MMEKHILLISQYFYPEPFRVNDIAQEWVKRGHKVTVLTGIPNYPEGSFYQGYSWSKKRRECWNGIEIIRIPLIPRGHTALQLIANYYSFVFFGWIWSAFSKLKPDLVFTFEVSPMTQALIGKWFSARRKIPNYLYVQDLWPENLEAVAGVKNKVVLNHFRRMSDNIYKACAKIFVTSPSFAQTVRDRVEDGKKVVYWPQYSENFYCPAQKQTNKLIPDDGRFKIVFAGNIGEAQGLEILPKTARLLDDSVCFVLIGNGRYRDRLVREMEDAKDKFILIDRQLPEAIPKLLASCDAAFLSFADNPIFEKTIPAKLQTYMACGMPIIASASGESKRIIEEAGCGVCCELGNPESLARGIRALQNANLCQYKDASLAYNSAHFSKSALMDFMEKELFGE